MKETLKAMKKTLFLTGIICILFLSSCAPKVTSRMTKLYEPLPEETPVLVFSSQNSVPEKAEILGEVKIKDSGFSTNCDSLTVINKIKNEARKSGGNAVIILKHKKPSIWGSSCHQMEAAILNITDFNKTTSLENMADNTDMNDYKETKTVQNSKKERLLPQFMIAINGGYGWRTAKLADNIEGDEKDFLRKMKNGPAWNASANYFFNDNYGLGLTYSGFSASNSSMATQKDDGQSGAFKMNDMITYIGPSFLMRFSSNQKWIFNANIGIGYIGYSSKSNFLDNEMRINGSSVGVLYELGVEYKLSKNWGIGANFSCIGGTLGTLHKEENGYKETVKLSKDEREGLGQIRLGLGVRYYLK